MTMGFVSSPKTAKMAIYVDSYQIFPIIEIIKTLVFTPQSKVDDSIFTMDLRNFECSVKIQDTFNLWQM